MGLLLLGEASPSVGGKAVLAGAAASRLAAATASLEREGQSKQVQQCSSCHGQGVLQDTYAQARVTALTPGGGLRRRWWAAAGRGERASAWRAAGSRAQSQSQAAAAGSQYAPRLIRTLAQSYFHTFVELKQSHTNRRASRSLSANPEQKTASSSSPSALRSASPLVFRPR